MSGVCRRTFVDYYCGPYASRVPDNNLHHRFAQCIAPIAAPPLLKLCGRGDRSQTTGRGPSTGRTQIRRSAADTLLSKDFILTAASDGTLRSKSEFLPMIGDKSDPLEVLEYGAMQIHVYGDT